MQNRACNGLTAPGWFVWVERDRARAKKCATQIAKSQSTAGGTAKRQRQMGNMHKMITARMQMSESRLSFYVVQSPGTDWPWKWNTCTHTHILAFTLHTSRNVFITSCSAHVPRDSAQGGKRQWLSFTFFPLPFLHSADSRGFHNASCI